MHKELVPTDERRPLEKVSLSMMSGKHCKLRGNYTSDFFADENVLSAIFESYHEFMRAKVQRCHEPTAWM